MFFLAPPEDARELNATLSRIEERGPSGLRNKEKCKVLAIIETIMDKVLAIMGTIIKGPLFVFRVRVFNQNWDTKYETRKFRVPPSTTP